VYCRIVDLDPAVRDPRINWEPARTRLLSIASRRSSGKEENRSLLVCGSDTSRLCLKKRRTQDGAEPGLNWKVVHQVGSDIFESQIHVPSSCNRIDRIDRREPEKTRSYDATVHSAYRIDRSVLSKISCQTSACTPVAESKRCG
jgi:hypothetical protein